MRSPCMGTLAVWTLTLGEISIPCKQILCSLISPRMFTCPEGVELPLINYNPTLVDYFVVCHVGSTPHSTFAFSSLATVRTNRFMTNLRVFILWKKLVLLTYLGKICLPYNPRFLWLMTGLRFKGVAHRCFRVSGALLETRRISGCVRK